jgi:hypothetical protein
VAVAWKRVHEGPLIELIDAVLSESIAPFHVIMGLASNNLRRVFLLPHSIKITRSVTFYFQLLFL